MDLQKDWLAPTIRDDLSQAYKWKKESSGGEQLTGATVICSDDGSNLRIQSSQNGVVQICKFSEFKEPIVATVADKSTRIHVRFSIAATREYRNQQKRPFTKDKTGGLIQILDFEIVVTDFGPRPYRLMLFVKRFRSLGSDGSAVPDVPRPIESPDKGCLELLGKLKEMHNQEKFDGSQAPSTRESSAEVPSIQSQTALVTSNEASPDSQSFLITQVPVARKMRMKPDQPAVASKTDNYEKSGTAKSFVSRVEIKQPSSDAAKHSRSGDSKPVNGVAHHSRDPADRLLNGNRDKSVTPNTNRTAFGINGATKDPSFNEESLIDAHERANARFRYGSHSSTENHIVQESIQSPGPNLALSETPRRPSKKRKLNDKISSRDVKIPKDQEALLNRKDSWLPAEPGQNEPRANIPIVLLQAFNEDADGRQRRLAAAQESPRDRAASVHDEDSLGTETSDSESDIASAQWPASPERNQLPPDSSPPEVDVDRKVKETGPNETAQQTLEFDDMLSKAVSGSSNDQTGKELIKETSDSNAVNGANHPISLLSSSLNGSAQPISKEGSQGHMEELIDIAQDSHPSLQDNLHLENVSTNEDQSKIGLPSPELIPSGHSLPDSDIEMTVPLPLHGPTERPASPSPRGIYPSTAPLSKQPFTQVKRTPYTDGHSREESSGRFASGWRLMHAEHKGSINGMPEEGNTHIPCTTSTFLSNIEDSATSSGDASKQLVDRDHASPRENWAIEEAVARKPSPVADAKSSRDYNGLPVHESLLRKRLLQDNDLSNDVSRSKRFKPVWGYSDADSFELRPKSPRSPILKASDRTGNPANFSSLEIPAARNVNGKGAARETEAFSNSNHSIEPDDNSANFFNSSSPENLRSKQDENFMETDSATITTQTNKSNADNTFDLHKQVPPETTLKDSGIGLPQAESHSAPQPCLPFKGGGPRVQSAETSANDTVDESLSLPSTSKSHKSATDSARIVSHTAINNNPEHQVHDREKPRAASSPQVFFDHFRLIYPDYTGNIKHFSSLCSNIDKLRKQDRLHKAMWDDFLIRSKIEYAGHVQKCMENGEDPLPYEKFYNEEIDEPKYHKKVLTPLNLEMIIHGDRSGNISSHTSSMASTPIKKKCKDKFPDATGKVVTTLRAGVNSHTAIDLTQENVVTTETTGQGSVRSPILQPSSRRRIPWLDHHNDPETSVSESRHSRTDKQRRQTPPEPTKHRLNKISSPEKQPRPDSKSSKSGKSQSQSANVIAKGDDMHGTLSALWWQDDNTPVKNLIRSYLAIRPGNGNTYARPEDVAKGRREQERNTIHRPEDLDVWNWKV